MNDPARRCAECGAPLPPDAATTRRTCSTACRVRYSRRRRAEARLAVIRGAAEGRDVRDAAARILREAPASLY